MIRLESKMDHALEIPIPGPGKSTLGFLTLPAKSKDGPGVLDTDKLDQVTLARLQYHYDWRPSDGKNRGKRRNELPADGVIDVGLIRIRDLDAETAPDRKSRKAA